MARIDGPGGMKLRVGVVNPEDTRVWRAENKGRTVEFDAAGAEKFREVLHNALEQGKQNVSDFRAQLRAARAAGVPESQWPHSEAEIASGLVKGARWGDVRWSLTREEGPDYVAGGVNYGPGGEWNLAIDPAPAGAPDATRDSFHAATAATVNKLDKAISNLTRTAGG